MLLPPTMHQLLEDTAFRAYMRRVPRLPPTLAYGTPWAVYAVTADGRWRTGLFHTYAEAWGVVVKAIRAAHVRDVSLVSRRQVFHPPVTHEDYKVRVRRPGQPPVIEMRTRTIETLAHVIDWPFEWCFRCRRPTTFEKYPTHHALRGVPMDPDEPRCYFCGVRKEFARYE